MTMIAIRINQPPPVEISSMRAQTFAEVAFASFEIWRILEI